MPMIRKCIVLFLAAGGCLLIAGRAPKLPAAQPLHAFGTIWLYSQDELIGVVQISEHAEIYWTPPEDDRNPADFDGDGDVDMTDFIRFQEAWTGAR